MGVSRTIPSKETGDIQFDQADWNVLTSSAGHFILHYKTVGIDKVTETLVQDAGDDLESAYTKYGVDFDKPLVPINKTVNVWFINQNNTTFPPNPVEINLNGSWFTKNTNNRLIRRATAAHEAFHCLQGRYGYEAGTKSDGFEVRWFLEGTAEWAVLHFFSVSGNSNTRFIGAESYLDWLFDNPGTPINTLAYGTLPMWIFFEALFKSLASDGHNPFVDVFNKQTISDSIDPVLSLRVKLKDWFHMTKGSDAFNFFLVLFGAHLAQGTWYKPDGTSLYETIVDASDPKHGVIFSTTNTSVNPTVVFPESWILLFTGVPQDHSQNDKTVTGYGLQIYKAEKGIGWVSSDTLEIELEVTSLTGNVYYGINEFDAATGSSDLPPTVPTFNPSALVPFTMEGQDVIMKGYYAVFAGRGISGAQGQTTYSLSAKIGTTTDPPKPKPSQYKNPTIVVNPDPGDPYLGDPNSMGQREGLSEGDIAKVARIYED